MLARNGILQSRQSTHLRRAQKGKAESLALQDFLCI